MTLLSLKGIRYSLVFIASILVTMVVLNFNEIKDKNEILLLEANRLEFKTVELKFENDILESKSEYDNEIILENKIAISKLEVQITEIKVELDTINKELEVFRDSQRTIIANSEDITIKSNISERQLSLILEGTGLEGLEKAYILAEKTYNINAIHLVSLTALESAWGESRLAVDKNNISGFSAYDSNPYNDAKYFASKDECIMTTAKTLNENYVGKDLISLKQINSKYASDVRWHSKIAVISKVIIKNIE